tara:strand:- start:31784 stop:31942 length:159 start_codon:yes stop_codon:yes gene_type:complete
MIHPVTTVKGVVHTVEDLEDIQDPTAPVVDVVELVKCQINYKWVLVQFLVWL